MVSNTAPQPFRNPTKPSNHTTTLPRLIFPLGSPHSSAVWSACFSPLRFDLAASTSIAERADAARLGAPDVLNFSTRSFVRCNMPSKRDQSSCQSIMSSSRRQGEAETRRVWGVLSDVTCSACTIPPRTWYRCIPDDQNPHQKKKIVRALK